MPIPSFHDWLGNRPDEASAADRLATLISSAGATGGVSLDRLRALVRLPPDTLQDILRSLVMTGLVVVLKVNGQRVYRAAG